MFWIEYTVIMDELWMYGLRRLSFRCWVDIMFVFGVQFYGYGCICI